MECNSFKNVVYIWNGKLQFKGIKKTGISIICTRKVELSQAVLLKLLMKEHCSIISIYLKGGNL